MEFYHISRVPLHSGTVIQPVYYDRMLHNLNSHEIHNQYLKEIIFEEIRVQHYSDKASRLKSIYCFSDIGSAVSYKGSQGYLSISFLYQIKVLGDPKTSTYDMRWLDCSFNTYEDIKKYAHDYFSGKVSDNPSFETLVEGTAAVSEELKFLEIQ